MIEPALLSCKWLQKNINTDDQVILDATFFLPRQHRNAKEEYLRQHIPGALFFDIDEVADKSSNMAHMLPKAEAFAESVGKMGIGNDTLVLVYDNNHFFAAARVWWMFRAFGHKRVCVIDGGMARWKQLNLSSNSQQMSRKSKIFKANYHPELVFDLKQMRFAQRQKTLQIIDARSPNSFSWEGKLADKTIQVGHIQGSINIPYAGLTNCDNQMLLTNQALQLLFEAANINLSKPIVTTCGTGVSAAVLALVMVKFFWKDFKLLFSFH